MKMLAEYLDSAIKFETLAAAETDAKLKAQFEKQAEAYRKLAVCLRTWGQPMAKLDDKGRAVARSSGLGRTALVFDDNDVVDLLRIAIERQGANPPLLGTTALIAVC